MCVLRDCVHRPCLSHVGAFFTMRALVFTHRSICSISRMNMYMFQRKKCHELGSLVRENVFLPDL